MLFPGVSNSNTLHRHLILLILWSNTNWPADVTGPRTIVWEPDAVIDAEDIEPGTRIEKTAHMVEANIQGLT